MALINCPECGKEISDAAIMCVQCGCPINYRPLQNIGHSGANRVHKYHRLPNGYGNIKKLSGKRRMQYAAYPPVKEYKDNGSAVSRSALGYFATYQEAMNCLVEYNKNPYELANKDITFSEVYERYYKDKFNDAKKQYSASLIKVTKAGFNNLKDIHNVPIAQLRTPDMQKVVDACTLKHASIEQMVLILKSVCKYALQNDFIQKDYSQFVRIKIADDDEKGIPFTENDIKTLWKNAGNYSIDIILIMIYTGFRISELENIEINYEEKYFKGGVKTAAGKDRIVPFNKKIEPLVCRIQEMPFKARNFRVNYFYQALTNIGLNEANNGVKHTPHDCRHTFSWLADKYKIDTLSKHLIMGHSMGNKDVETTVYGHRTLEELRTEINKIK